MRWAGDRNVSKKQIDVFYEIEPKAIKFEDDHFQEVSMSANYVNPFETNGLSLNAQAIIEQNEADKAFKKAAAVEKELIVLSGTGRDIPSYNSQARKWVMSGLDGKTKHKLTVYREKYEAFLRQHNNTANKEVWKIYDHIANELMREQLNKALDVIVTKDIEEYVEQVIVDEF